MSDDLAKLRGAIEAWSRGAPVSSAEAARAEVLARIERPSRLKRWRFAVVASSAAAVLAAIVVVFLPTRTERPLPPTHDAGEPVASRLVLELDSGAKLYYALDSDRSDGSQESNETPKGDV